MGKKQLLSCLGITINSTAFSFNRQENEQQECNCPVDREKLVRHRVNNYLYFIIKSKLTCNTEQNMHMHTKILFP